MGICGKNLPVVFALAAAIVGFAPQPLRAAGETTASSVVPTADGGEIVDVAGSLGARARAMDERLHLVDLREPSPGARPRAVWSATAEAVVFGRSNGPSARLMTLADGFDDLSSTQMLNARQMNFAWSAGPRISVLREGPRFDLEATFMSVTGWSAQGSQAAPPVLVYPANPASTVDGASLSTGVFAFEERTSLYGTELNVGHRWSDAWRGFIGFRYFELHDRLTGNVRPSGTTSVNVLDIAVPNLMYGGQLGLKSRMFAAGELAVDTFVKAGLFTDVIDVHHRYFNGTTTFVQDLRGSHTTFVGELGVNASYHLAWHTRFVVGYQAMWFNGVALASAQVNTLVPTSPALSSISDGSSLVVHGVNIGVESRY